MFIQPFIVTTKIKQMKNLDEIDKKLLNVLQENSRITIRELSEKLFLSTTPIHERIKKLEKSGYIKAYTTLLDSKKIGRGLIVFINVSLGKHTKEAIEEFGNEMDGMEEVMEAYYISGSSDFLLKVYCKDMDDFHNFITNKFSIIKNITQFYSSFVMAESKATHSFKL